MSVVNISNIVVKNSKAQFTAPIELQVTFECLRKVQEEIEWSIIYVGSPLSDKHDQTLDHFSMGPLLAGTMQFDLQVDPPVASLIPPDDLTGITAIMISVSYHQSEFFRAGYYICNQYPDDQEPILDNLQRTILSDKPRITRFEIDWDNKPGEGSEVGQSYMLSEVGQSYMPSDSKQSYLSSESEQSYLPSQQPLQSSSLSGSASHTDNAPLEECSWNIQKVVETAPPDQSSSFQKVLGLSELSNLF